MIDQKIRKDAKGKVGSIATVTLSTKNSAGKAITGINKLTNILPENMKMKPIVSTSNTRNKSRKTKHRTSKPKATPSRMLCLWVK